MPTYTIHAPPPKKGETASAPERFRFVRDGFHFWAFLLTPLWLLVRRLWLAFVIYVIAYGLLMFGLTRLGVSSTGTFIVGLVIGLLMGFEASSIQRWTYARRRWQSLGFVVGDDLEMAERRFYAEWAKRPEGVPVAPPAAPDTTYTPPAPVLRSSPGSDEVIGLFPEPGASR